MEKKEETAQRALGTYQMNVKDLIEALEKMPQDALVVYGCESYFSKFRDKDDTSYWKVETPSVEQGIVILGSGEEVNITF